MGGISFTAGAAKDTTAVTVAGGLMFIEHLLWAGALNVAIPFLLQQRCEDYGTLQRRTRG